MKVRDALAGAAQRLAATSETARFDAELLMAHALGLERPVDLLARLDDPVPDAFEALVARRERFEPVAYITGRRGFWTIELEVGPGVLVPRPDSETLIEAALQHFGYEGPAILLDLGTGPGTLLLAALDQWPQARGLGIDASEEALGFARRNAEALGLAARAELRQGDWLEGVEGRFDLILCNPPYVGLNEPLPADVRDWEPAGALYAGADGLGAYRHLLPRLGAHLAPGGMAALEIGASQAEAVGALARAAGLSSRLFRDLGCRDRCLVLEA
jgi:release factor glutamine methyltransferase